MKDFRNPSTIHAPLGSYSHQIEITGSERMLILSGQIGMREDGTLPDDALEQIEVALENIIRNLQAANMDVKDLVKLTYYLVGEEVLNLKNINRFTIEVSDSQGLLKSIMN